MLFRQQALAHQVLVCLSRGFATLGDGPDYEGGTAFGVTCNEGAWLSGAEAILGVYGARGSVAEVHLPHKAVAHRSREADGEEDEVCLYLEVRALDGDGLAVSTLGLYSVHLFDVAACTREAFDGAGEAALASLLVGWVGVQDEGPVGPGEVVGVVGRAGAVGQDLHGGAPLTMRVAEAVRARVAAAEDDDVLAR